MSEAVLSPEGRSALLGKKAARENVCVWEESERSHQGSPDTRGRRPSLNVLTDDQNCTRMHTSTNQRVL